MIVVGYTADPFGQAALEHGIAEAKLRGTLAAGGQLDRGRRLRRRPLRQSTEVHDVEERLANCGVAFELTQPVGVDAAEELLTKWTATTPSCW